MRRRLLIITGIACLIGMTLAILSTTQHFRILEQGFEQESFCVVSEKINCDLVTGSTYSELFGVPIAWWGTLYYGLLALMSLFAAFSRKTRRATVSIAWFMALAGVPYCIVLGYIAVFVLGAVCLECFGMYAVTIFAAIALYVALNMPVRKAPAYIRDYAVAAFGGTNRLGFNHAAWKHVIVIALVFGTGWLAITGLQSKAGIASRSAASVEALLRAHYMKPRRDIPVDPAWAVWGNPDAPVKIVEFSEYQCPFCRLAAFTLKPYLHQFRKDIAYYFVNYPLDSNCNPALSHPMHPLACYLARAGMCAEAHGVFWEYHDDLFRNQRLLSKRRAIDIAANSFGLDREQFQRCISSPEIEVELSREIKLGRKLGLRGTPSIFIEGRRIKDWRNKKFLQTLVQQEIERARHQRH